MIDWQPLFYRSFSFFAHVIILYVGMISSIYFLMIAVGWFAIRRYHARLTPEERQAILKSPLVPEISVIVPAHNEAVTIRDSVKTLLKLNYPNHRVIVVNDGSKDDTMHLLIEEFHLYRSARVASGPLSHKPVHAVYESCEPIRLLVVDKENGGKADALNAGLNIARSPLIAAVDSDSLLDPDALLQVVKPFLEDPDHLLACGGIVRVANGCQVRHGRVARIATSGSLLALFQTVEYLRAFLGGRSALSFLNCLLIISGAFGVFRRDAVISAGGFSTRTVGEDMELVVRLHEIGRDKKADYRIRFVCEPVCWTEVPQTARILKRQRNRWQRGTVESILLHSRMLFAPRFGALGLFAFPYFILFEMLGPAVETAGYLLMVVGLALRIISLEIAILFFVVSVLFGILLSMSAVALEASLAQCYPTGRDVGRMFAASILENLGFRQVLALWRTQGLIDGLRGKRGWEAMERKGFGKVGADLLPARTRCR